MEFKKNVFGFKGSGYTIDNQPMMVLLEEQLLYKRGVFLYMSVRASLRLYIGEVRVKWLCYLLLT